MNRLTHGLLVGLLAAFVATPTAAAGGSEVWMEDLGSALEVAQRDGKDVLVDFTGSDWCGWCIRLDKEVFSQDEFLEYAQQTYVLVALDFPREDGETWKAMSPEQRERNRQEAMRYQVQGFPTILLLSPDGVSYGRTGYQAGGPEAYNEHLEAMRTEGGAKARKGVATLRSDTASADDRLEAGYALFAEAREELREEILTLVRREDPQDSRGLLAEEEVRRILREHLETETPDLPAASRELAELGTEQPRVKKVVQYHFARAWVALELEDLSTARDAVEHLEQLDDTEPGMIDWLRERLESAVGEDS